MSFVEGYSKELSEKSFFIQRFLHPGLTDFIDHKGPLTGYQSLGPFQREYGWSVLTPSFLGCRYSKRHDF